MWMSDIHSIGGYTFAAGLFFLGLAGWQVLLALIIGIDIGALVERSPADAHRRIGQRVAILIVDAAAHM